MPLVQVYIYDLSFGLANQMSLAMLGRHIEGIWHTSIVHFGREYFFSSRGIENCAPGMTAIGQPLRKHDLGESQLDADIFMEYLTTIGNERFRLGTYDLFNHNCNTFTNEVGQFLTGNSIPSYITNLPSEVLSTPFGGMIRQFMSSMNDGPGGGVPISSPVNTQQLLQRPAEPTNQLPAGSISSNQQNMVSKSTSRHSESTSSGAQEGIVTAPVIFSEDLDKIQSCIKQLKESLENHNTDVVERLDRYLTNQNHSTENEIELVKQALIPGLSNLTRANSGIDNTSSSTSTKIAATVLKYLATKESSLQLFCDNYENLILVVADAFSSVTVMEEKVEIVKMLCNVLAKAYGAKYLTSKKQYSVNSNGFVFPENLVTSIIVSCLLDESIQLQNIGSALVLNFAIANPSEEVSFECASALIEMMHHELNWVSAHYSLSALSHLLHKNEQIIHLIEATELDTEKISVQHPKLRDICQKIAIHSQ